MRKVTVSVKVWDSRIREVQKAEVRAEIDGLGDVFFKIEGKNDDEVFMIDYSYNKQDLLDKYFEIVRMLIDKQSEILTA